MKFARYDDRRRYAQDLKAGKVEEYFWVDKKVVVPHYMINVTTTLNAAKLLNHNLGWDNCERWLHYEDVGSIFGATGEIGGGKTTWLHAMLCSYIKGWNDALVWHKRRNESKESTWYDLYAPKATMHSMLAHRHWTMYSGAASARPNSRSRSPGFFLKNTHPGR